MYKSRSCRTCGGLDEFVYEINWRPVYYCATCRVESGEPGSKLVSVEERLEEEAGGEPGMG